MLLPQRTSDKPVTARARRLAKRGGLDKVWAAFRSKSTRTKLSICFGIGVVALVTVYFVLAVAIGGGADASIPRAPARFPGVGRHVPKTQSGSKYSEQSPSNDTFDADLASIIAGAMSRAGEARNQPSVVASLPETLAKSPCTSGGAGLLSRRTTCNPISLPNAHGIGRGFVALENSGALFLQYLLIQTEHLRSDSAPWEYDRLNGFPTVQVLDDRARYRTHAGRSATPNERGSTHHRLHDLWYGHVSRLASNRYPFDSMTAVYPFDLPSHRVGVDGPAWCGNLKNRHGSALLAEDDSWRLEGYGKKPYWWDQFVEQKRKRGDSVDEDTQLPQQCRELAGGPMEEILTFLNGSRINVHARCPGFAPSRRCWTSDGTNPDGCVDWRLGVLVRDPRDVIMSMFEEHRGPATKFSFKLKDCPWLGSDNDVHFAGRDRDLCDLCVTCLTIAKF